MNYVYFFFFAIIFSLNGFTQNLSIPFDDDTNTTVTYQQGIDFWAKLSNQHPELQMIKIGNSDIGKPIHLLLLSEQGLNEPSALAENKKPTILINNAIHAGEPCGVEATILLFRDYFEGKVPTIDLSKVNIALIPFYNIGGVLNRNSATRANQNGPREYGFRGNAKHLDLNRDFIKADSENAAVFNRLVAQLKPNVFIDNHTTNGANYQPTMTLISSMVEHYEQPLSKLLEHNLLPFLFQKMNNTEYKMSPYVFSVGETPFDGIKHFNDLPRYSMGYASLHNALSFTPEAHMLKPYKDRVAATYALNKFIINWVSAHSKQLMLAKQKAEKTFHQGSNQYVLQWKIDTTQSTNLQFDGYKFGYKKSKVTDQNRLFYDETKPVTETIPFYNRFEPKLVIQKPKKYVIPQAYAEVINRLKWNGVQMDTLKTDHLFIGELYKIRDYETTDVPYEGHYLHSNVKVEPQIYTKQFYKGDVVVPVNQPMAKYILETLEPQAQDSFFAWNFFDGILMQKEHFSPYVFEDEASALLKKHPEWRQELQAKKAADPNFAKNTYAQLKFIYEKTDHFEQNYLLYPVMRITE